MVTNLVRVIQAPVLRSKSSAVFSPLRRYFTTPDRKSDLGFPLVITAEFKLVSLYLVICKSYNMNYKV